MKSLTERFYEEANKWSNETAHLSSPTQIQQHPSYQTILNLAVEHKNEIIQLMLQDMKRNHRHWFSALYFLTKENPIQPSDNGKIDKMIDAWINLEKQKR